MQTSVTFRHIDASEALREHALSKALKVEKYFFGPKEAHVVLSIERHMYKAEINVLANGMVICGKDSSSDMYYSIDRAIEKIEKQLKRYHDKLVHLKPRKGAKMKEAKRLEMVLDKNVSEHPAAEA